MSYLSIALQRQTERRHLNQSDVARGAGLSRSYISRLFSGEAHELSDQNFTAILKIFSADQLAQAEIIAARCMDAKSGTADFPGADLVEIRVRRPASSPGGRPPGPGEKTEESCHEPAIQLPAETERAFAWLRSQCPLNPDLEKHLVGYAKLTGMK